MPVAVVAEKPSVARDIADCLGATKKLDGASGALEGNGYIVTWAIGHLVTLPEPHQINASWKTWSRATLPMIPPDWPVVVIEKTAQQFNIVRQIMNRKDVSEIICATDAGREGELIFRYIYEAAKCKKRVRRLWISSLTPAAIRRGFDTLKPSSDYDNLARSAHARSRADWLVGMNFSRAYTIRGNDLVSVGRVQTPTLAMIVERELAIRNFKPEKYFEIIVDFRPEMILYADRTTDVYRGTWFSETERRKRTGTSQDPLRDASRLPFDRDLVERIASRVRTGRATVASLTSRTRTFAPPLLYDLSELQRHANRLFGFSAQKTLDIAQELYEGKKLISYPRTDSRHLSTDIARTLEPVIAVVAPHYRPHWPFDEPAPPIPDRFVDDTKVSDHHAIIPTPTRADRATLTADQLKLYDLICRRFLCAWLPPHIALETTVITDVISTSDVASEPLTDRFHSSGTLVRQEGWKVLELKARKDSDQAPSLPSSLVEGQSQSILKVEAVEKETRPPQRLTDATLLTAMETAGKTLDDRNLSDAMRERGLGTPATRAAIIETLIKREFIRRDGKSLSATDKGIRLIETVHPSVRSPELTGDWEYKLKRMEKGAEPFDRFMSDIETYVRDIVRGIFTHAAAPRPAIAAVVPSATQPMLPIETAVPSVTLAVSSPKPSPAPPSLPPDSPTLETALSHYFGYPAFRPYQKAVCEAVIGGTDALLVMPTGMGKSLCYQLPALIRGGSALVISPLIALMEDQSGKLAALGLRSDAVHSGKKRSEYDAIMNRYASGELQYLFIAPERLSLQGFIHRLQQHPPSLIVVDEAHCISQWGHDFRPDYRMLGERLPEFRSAPVIAMTATATPRVQDDIVTLLGMPSPRRFIHGFRRTNIGVEIVGRPVDERLDAARAILSDPSRRPAIVYAATRRNAEWLAEHLNRDFSADVYHAGMTPTRRNAVQTAFLEGRLDVIVATIAFGMGIDKPDIRTVIHAALPGSIEGYYQEIGRAGRDGLPSRAILFHSYADQRIQDFLFQKNYPETAILERIFTALGEEFRTRDEILAATRIDAEVFDNAIEKLWIHSGAIVEGDDRFRAGSAGWTFAYAEQRAFRQAQLKEMSRFAEGSGCRMQALIRHFGDMDDREGPCGVCDVCAPQDQVASARRAPDADEAVLIWAIVSELRRKGSLTAGQLHKSLSESHPVVRNEMEQLLSSLSRHQIVSISEQTFEKEGETIHYKRIALAKLGRELTQADVGGIELTHPRKQTAKRASKRRKTAKTSRTAPALPSGAVSGRNPRTARSRTTAPVERRTAAVRIDASVHAALRQWRLDESRRLGVPAFRIFSNQVLDALAARQPLTEEELGGVAGVGPALMKRYGKLILKLIAAVRAGRG